ncbi:squalene synthase HpnC [Pelomonas sp. SE-A7]|uniref:squalene synthase HpnC n=1 Tax=Pelomonas sp. SE-A7 TaxID=3054953 RepID=UPI00259C7AB6|nr:squalene synthase HpnC [Pelomonas sp. SE-A7]MDM4767425.1 squalene synthase HpnC [Pelomonas sp. SE-A7]
MPLVSIEHYENFPVASWLCPPRLRPAVVAIYGFARTADDLADEGEDTPAQRAQDLQAYRADLHAMARGARWSHRWAPVFDRLSPQFSQHGLPLQLLDDLLDAFLQDLHKQRYADRPELLDYCRRSANPVGRLLLHLYGVTDPEALRRSDAICTSLQLINFWQDPSRDIPNGRCYAPASDLARHGIDSETWLAGQDSSATKASLADLCAWAGELMESGAPLVHQIPGRAGWELRLVVQGGLRILEKIAAMDFATLRQRPALNALDTLPMMWRALFMRARQDLALEARS